LVLQRLRSLALAERNELLGPSLNERACSLILIGTVVNNGLVCDDWLPVNSLVVQLIKRRHALVVLLILLLECVLFIRGDTLVDGFAVLENLRRHVLVITEESLLASLFHDPLRLGPLDVSGA
jgi:hypothetical protein